MERYREKGSFLPSKYSSFWWNTGQSPKPTPTYSDRPNCLGDTKKMWDVVVPSFERRRDQGELFVNPMYSIAETKKFLSTGPSFKAVISGKTYWGELLGGPWGETPDGLAFLSGHPAPSLNDFISEVQTRALSNVKPPSYQGLVAIGEFRETMRYLKNPFKQGSKLADKLNKRVGIIRTKNPDIVKQIRSQQNSAAVRELESLYLEFRYGVRPLMSDVTNFLEALRSKKETPERVTYRASSENLWTDEWVDTSVTLGGSPLISYDRRVRYTRRALVRCGLLYQVFDKLDFSDKWGLGIDQIPSAVWELIPLSFVADWFTNVGDFIGAITPVSGQNRLAEWTVVRTEELISSTSYNWKFNTAGWSTSSDGSGTDSWIRVIKHRTPSIGVPEVHIKSKWADTFSDPYKVLDLIGLTHQRIQGSRVSFKEEFFF